SLRGKLGVIVGTAAVSFLLLIGASSFIAHRVEQQLISIQGHYVPRVELGPQLETAFEQIRRAFQDAGAAHDSEALRQTAARKDRLLARLSSAESMLDPREVAAFRSAFADYYGLAYDLSQRLIANETGESIVADMTTMQGKQERTLMLLKKMTELDKSELVDA